MVGRGVWVYILGLKSRFTSELALNAVFSDDIDLRFKLV